MFMNMKMSLEMVLVISLCMGVLGIFLGRRTVEEDRTHCAEKLKDCEGYLAVCKLGLLEEQ